MIRSPVALRLPSQTDLTPKEQLRNAARLGARGVVLDASGDFSPTKLSETGRRDLRHTLRTLELSVVALHLPTKRPYDSREQIEERMKKASTAFVLAYELGASLALARVGAIPPEVDEARTSAFSDALSELGQRADHQGVRLAIETGPDSGDALRTFLETRDELGLGASLDPGALLRHGFDPVATTKVLGEFVIHAYARDAIDDDAGMSNPRGFGFAPGVLDWEEYLGALEEINYDGFLTVWPDFNRPIAPQFQQMVERFAKF